MIPITGETDCRVLKFFLILSFDVYCVMLFIVTSDVFLLQNNAFKRTVLYVLYCIVIDKDITNHALLF